MYLSCLGIPLALASAARRNPSTPVYKSHLGWNLHLQGSEVLLKQVVRFGGAMVVSVRVIAPIHIW